jgi:hypothetical protein
MGVFLRSTEATPCGHLHKWKLTPENPPADTMFIAAMAVVLPWKIVEDIQSFVKYTKLWPSLQKSVSCKKMSLKSSQWSCLKAWFKSYTFCFTTFLIRPSTGARRSHERAPKKRPNELEGSKFCQQVQGFVCVPPWRRVTFKFSEMRKNASEVTLVPRNFFFLKILNFVQSFVQCKVSLADGILQTCREHMQCDVRMKLNFSLW